MLPWADVSELPFLSTVCPSNGPLPEHVTTREIGTQPLLTSSRFGLKISSPVCPMSLEARIRGGTLDTMLVQRFGNSAAGMEDDAMALLGSLVDEKASRWCVFVVFAFEFSNWFGADMGSGTAKTLPSLECKPDEAQISQSRISKEGSPHRSGRTLRGA